MTTHEIQQLQVGNYLLIGDMLAFVARVSIIPADHRDNHVGRTVRIYEGAYNWGKKLADGGIGWMTSDSPEFNEDYRLMSLDEFHGIPIPDDFEDVNDTEIPYDAWKKTQYVHQYQNWWSIFNEPKDDWVINVEENGQKA